MTFIGFLNWAGGLSCSLGSLLALVSLLKGREARQLAGATNLDSLGGAQTTLTPHWLALPCWRSAPPAAPRRCQHCSTARADLEPADLHQLVGLVPLLVAVTGRVFADRPLKCELSDGKGAIVEVRPVPLAPGQGACLQSQCHWACGCRSQLLHAGSMAGIRACAGGQQHLRQAALPAPACASCLARCGSGRIAMTVCGPSVLPLQLRVERKSERRQNSYWYTDTTPLREQLRETNWWLKGEP